MTKNSKPLRLRAQRFKGYLPLYLMMLPAFVYLLINNYWPMSGLVLAFKKYTVQGGIWGSQWVGLRNFQFLFRNNETAIMVRNTLCYNLAFMVINVIVGVFLAILITEIGNKTLRKLAQSSVLLPFVVSIIIVSYMVRAFLDADTGLLNSLIVACGGKKTSWYDTPGPWPFILTLVNTWKGAGYGCILYISTIMGIDPSLYEVAHLSGASKLQSIRYVTLPYLKPTIITMVLLNMGRIFNSDFGLFFQVPQNSGMIIDVTQTIDTFVYRGLIVQPNIGMTAAASFLQSCIGFALVLAFNAITRKVSRDDALF